MSDDAPAVSDLSPARLVLMPATDAQQAQAALAVAGEVRRSFADLFEHRARRLSPPDPVLLAVAGVIRATQFYVARE